MPVPQDPFAELPVLKGQAVVLMPLGPDVDLDAYAAILGDPEVRFFTGSSRPLSREVLAAWLASRLTQSNRADFAVYSRVDGYLLGEAVLSEVDAESESAAYRILLGSRARDRGTGTEVTRMVTDFAFSVGLHRVWLEVRDDNPRARRTYEKCGYAVEGRLRDALLFDGQRVDMLVMAALAPSRATR